MQHGSLTVDKVLDHAKDWHGHREIVSRSVEGPIVRTTYAELHERAKKVSNALLGLGVKAGDRVATLAWNTARHMEAWYGIAGIGAIYHTLNPRLHPDQLAWIINHAEDTVIFTDITFIDVLQDVLGKCPSVRHVIVMTDDAHLPKFKVTGVPALGFNAAHSYEALIAGQSSEAQWGGFDEETACGLCYTSGTTGDPKGVLYSHRSNTIHTMMALQADAMGVSALDTVLAIVPMFHANAWGLAFSCPAVGAKLIMPGQKLDGASVYELLDSEQVTLSAAVPTVWQGLLGHLRANNLTLPHLKKVIIGGSACPESLIRAFHDDYGVEVIHAWGMTETSPLGTLATMTPELAKLSFEEQLPFRLKQGRPPLGVELKLVNDAGTRLPWDGTTFGKLMVRGPIIAKGYFKGAGGDILDEEGFFDTGDVATIDTHGFMQITDRAKDVIKSGGEWISSIDIENIAMGHPAVELAAVIGVAHPKWDERPLLMVKLKPGMEATKEELIRFLDGKIARWWTPDDVMFVDDIPLGPTGKIDKKILRTRIAGYVLPETPILATLAPVAAAAAATVALAAARAPVLVAPEPEAEFAAEPVAETVAEPVAEVAAEPVVEAPIAPEPVAETAPPEPEIEDAVIEEPERPAPPPTIAEMAPAPIAVATSGPPEDAAVTAAEGLAWATAPSPKPAPPAPVEDAAPVEEPARSAVPVGAAAAVAGLSAFAAARFASSGQPGHVDAPTVIALGDPTHVAVMPAEDADGDLPEPLPNMPGFSAAGEARPAAPKPVAMDAKPAEPAKAAPAAVKPAAGPAPLTLAPPSPPAGEPLAFAFSPSGSLAGGRAKSRVKTSAKSAKGGPPSFASLYMTLSTLLAFVPAAMVGGGALATRMGWLDWRQGFTAVLEHGPTPQLGWAPAIALVSLAASLMGVLIALFAGWGKLWGRALLALLVSVATLAAYWTVSAGTAHLPPIHEVATDWADPLTFSAATLKARADSGATAAVEPDPILPIGSEAYAGRRVAEVNAETCPGAQPVLLSEAPAQAFAAARAALAGAGMAVTTQDAGSGRLEAVATTPLYGFKDDVAVRIKSAPEGSRVDIRSTSRVGVGDLGQNCRRVTGLIAAMRG
ncbi:MAG: fatty-acyl-CoA synthase [Caulobacter sp.]|nr:fatty-acyl-CoA synthase [Caulobacter sp.]